MPDEEQGGGEKKSGGGGGGGLMSTKALVVVICVVVFEAIVFLVLLSMQSKRTDPDAAGDNTKPMQISPSDLAPSKLQLEGLNYSKVSPGGMQTLVMDMTIQLGPSKEEIASGTKPSAEDWVKVTEALKELRPEIEANLVSYIDKQSVSSLSSPRGKELIVSDVSDFIRTRLKELNIAWSNPDFADQEREPQVLITRFFIQ